MQNLNKNTLEDYKDCLQNIEIKNDGNKHEILMVRQKNLVLNTFDDKGVTLIDKLVIHGTIFLTHKRLREQSILLQTTFTLNHE